MCSRRHELSPSQGGRTNQSTATKTNPEAVATYSDWDLSFILAVKRRYHLRWERILAGYNRFLMGLIILSSSTIAIGLYSHIGITVEIAATALTLLGTLAFIFDWSGKAAIHRDLYRRFTELERRRTLGEDTQKLQADMTRIEGEELEIRSVIWMQGYNIECAFKGIDPEDKIRWWQAIFAPIIDLPPRHWLKVKTPE